MRGLAVHRHERLGLYDGQHDLQFLCRCMTGHMHAGARLVVYVGADLGQRVDHLRDGLFVAGNRRCRDDDGVSRFHIDGLMLACCDTGQCRQRLALATRAHDDHLLRRDAFRSYASMMSWSEIFKYPSLRAISVFCTMERPVTTTLRPFATAASQICCRRWIWLANDAMMTRPFACAMMR